MTGNDTGYEPRDAKAAPDLSLDAILVGGSLAIGGLFLMLLLAATHLAPMTH